ncbi:class I SAM-dependent methyltransferase [Kitasatospora terrestris]|uniref:class I SAM-dependent methyltransferase n=1 Tax=Kitasatospora terrestris TaxID=258051 RepID=UPI0031E575D4
MNSGRVEREKYDVWAAGAAYDRYMGRWSREVAGRFVGWLGCGAGLRWLDVGCGTGVLSAVVAERCEPRWVVGADRSEAFVRAAAERTASGFVVADAMALPVGRGTCDVAVSALMLNFLPEPGVAVAAMADAVRPGGTVASYVWDYAEGMGLLRSFWGAAASVLPAAADLDEGRRFPLCRPEALRARWEDAGLVEVSTTAVDVPTVFADFDDLWTPFLAGQGPAPAYVASLAPADRDRVRDALAAAVPRRPDGSIAFTARAWAVRGRRGQARE